MGKAFIGNFKGPQGDQGIQGEEGKASSIMIDSVQTLQPEENATVENVGTTSDARLKFGIPRGADGMTDLVARYEDASEYTATPTSDAPIVINDLNGITQQGENPSPDNPQMIHGVGDMGYFDGILQKGYYNASGVYTSADNYVCTVNKIECKQSDNINVELETTATSIIVSFFQSSGTFISQQTGSGKAITATAPANAGYCMISINRTSIEPQTARHISVTINGKYASRVESRTAQLFDASKLPSKKQGGATVTNNGDGSFTVSGSGQLSGNFQVPYTLSKEEAIPLLRVGELNLSANKTYPYFVFGVYKGDSSVKTIESSTSRTISITQDDINNIIDGTYNIKLIFNGYSGNNIVTDTTKPMVYQSGDGTWQPFRNTSIQFPLTNPLYDGDKVCYVKPGESYVDADGTTVIADRILYGCYRENAVVVFDGSKDEAWNKNNTGNDGDYVYYIKIKGKTNSIVLCDKLKEEPDINKIGIFGNHIAYPDIIYVNFGAVIGDNNLNGFKLYLQSNPLTVLYKLAQPYFEPFVDQTPFYNLRSFDNLTYICSDDPLNPTLTVDVAKNQTGGYIFESLAQAMKNAQKVEAAQSLEARIRALETQAVNNI